MKKSILKLTAVSSIIICMLVIGVTGLFAKETPSYQYEINTYFKWEPNWWDYTRVCRYDECTDNSGNTCDTPGSIFRNCKPLVWL